MDKTSWTYSMHIYSCVPNILNPPQNCWWLSWCHGACSRRLIRIPCERAREVNQVIWSLQGTFISIQVVQSAFLWRPLHTQAQQTNHLLDKPCDAQKKSGLSTPSRRAAKVYTAFSVEVLTIFLYSIC